MSRPPSSSESIKEKCPDVQLVETSSRKDEVLWTPPALTPDEEAKLWRKVDWHILPILTIMYLCSYLDRGEDSRSMFMDYDSLQFSLGNIGQRLYLLSTSSC